MDAPAANITAIVEEKSGHLWYGTLDGLFGFNDEDYTFGVITLPNTRISGEWIAKAHSGLQLRAARAFAPRQDGNVHVRQWSIQQPGSINL